MTELFPYQLDGARWLVEKKTPRAGLHDEMGIGKTATAIHAMEAIGARRAIVVVPAGLRANWLNEYRRFGTTGLRWCKARTVHDFVAWSRNRFDVLCAGYEMVTKWAPLIRQHGEFIDLIILDEAHYLKNTEAQRTRAIYGPECTGFNGVAEWAIRGWTLTGTPIPNDPIDVFPFLRFCNAISFDKDEFADYFLTPHLRRFGVSYDARMESAPDLRRLIENNALRRTHGQVGLQLPPILLTPMLVDGDTEQIKQWFREYGDVSFIILEALEAGGLSYLDAEHIATLRRLVGTAKALPYARLLYDEMCFTADKRVVFGIHTEALNHVHNFMNNSGIKSVLFTGQTSDYDREYAIRAFQNDPEVRVFVGNIRAAGTGHTLTAACRIDMLESDWSPAGNAQAIKRVHRIGQDDTVHARFITLSRTIDERVNEIVAEKTARIAEIEGFEMHAAPS